MWRLGFKFLQWVIHGAAFVISLLWMNNTLPCAQAGEHACHEFGVCLKLPHGWRHIKSDVQRSICVFAKGKEAFLCLLAPKGDGQWTAHSLLSSMLKDLKERNHDLSEVAPREVHPIDDGFILVATLRRPPEGEAQIFVWAAAVKVGKRLIGAVCTSAPSTADATKADMLVALRSLREITPYSKAEVRLPLPEGEFIISVESQPKEPCVTKPSQLAQPTPVAHHRMLDLLELRCPPYSPIPIEPLSDTKHRAALPPIRGEAAVDKNGICRLPWLGMQFHLPSGWKVAPIQRVTQYGAASPIGFYIIGEQENGFVPTLSLSFIPTLVGLALPKDAFEAAKRLAQNFLLPFGWRQRGVWQALTSQSGSGVMGLFDIPSTAEGSKTHAWVACMLFSDRYYATLLVGTCQCDGHVKLHEIYQRIAMSIRFEGGGK
ncbi:MAG: hypothetical protein RMK18_07065 [Armatimonadota bacterium]|nr:hypothetical protein [Armatimonadota bacterium]MDW8025609.1 hypothetical protein [Armatimonadota bacterium]